MPDGEVGKSTDSRFLDLFINGHDISHHVGDWGRCEETAAEWTLHTELIRNPDSSDLLKPLSGRKVQVKYRLRSNTSVGPWSSGEGMLNWRFTQNGNEELILHGTGQLKKGASRTQVIGTPVPATISKTTSIGGRVIKRDTTVGEISLVEEDAQQKAIRETQVRLAQEAEIQAITSPEFVLFLANSALSSYRLLHNAGTSERNGDFLYASLIFLPLAAEYWVKYLLIKTGGQFKDEYKNHKLLNLFDYLPFCIQEQVDDEFKNELENIGLDRAAHYIRMFLMKSQNTFTALRYLFDPRNAETSRHLLRPEHISVLTCVANALERVSKRI